MVAFRARETGLMHRNDGELSSQYYDPELRRKLPSKNRRRRNSDDAERQSDADKRDEKGEDPHSRTVTIRSRSEKTIGPTLPTRQDLQLRKGPNTHPTQTLPPHKSLTYRRTINRRR